jgi:hypothetical protein
MSTELASALIAGGVSILVAAVTAFGTFRTQERRLRAELRTEFMAEEAIRALLQHDRWSLRSFRVISAHIRGFGDDELRKLLIRAGALCFGGPPGAPASEEWWGLRERNQKRLGVIADRDQPPPAA